MNVCVYEPPTDFAPLFLAVDDAGRLARLGFVSDAFPAGRHQRPGDREAPGACAHVASQLDAYFRRERTRFELELAPSGTEFQLAVWDALLTIPYGETRTYGQIASRLGRPDASRAVGAANGANPIAIVIPCHRVIGADGALTGFGGGLPLKARLLELEQGSLFG